ncbi:MAG TPA: metal ABC transporter substrate-binding protein [Actinomycetales bacterium]|jgi:ABC-type Zn uptake system ZnuABC Zn-binding protein ZnuA
MIFPRSRSALALAAVVPLALASACGSSDDASTTPEAGASTGSRLSVVSTVAPITSIAANVIGDRADITGVVPEGTNSHTFEPPPQIAKTLERADVVFVNGLQLEEPTFELAEANAKEGSEILKIGDAVLPESEYIYDFSFPKEDGKPNPHLWTDPLYAIRYADQIKDVMVERDAANADYYTANHAKFVAKATELSEALKKDQETIPAGGRQLLTYHDAYAYFAKDYGWNVIGAVQPSNFEDPQPKEIANLVDQIKAQKVPVIFGSEVFPSKVLEQIAKETGARYEDTLRDDDLPGEPGDPEHSWMGLMRYDYVTMIKGLGGTASNLEALDTSDVAPDKADYPQ